MSKIRRRMVGKPSHASTQVLIQEIMKEVEEAKGVNGTARWKSAFSVLTRDKQAMTDYCSAEQSYVFEKYYALGENRSLKELAAITGHTSGRLQKWRRKYNWESKVVRRDIEVAAILKARSINSIVNVKIEYSGIIHQLVKEMLDNIHEYNEKVRIANKKAKNPKDLVAYKTLIYSADDFEKLVKLDLLMRGDVTERKESIVTENANIIEQQIAEDSETKELLKALYNKNRQYMNASKKIPIMIPPSNGNGHDKEYDATQGM